MKQKSISDSKIRKLNSWLLAAILCINAYTVSAPLLPQVQYWLADNGETRKQLESVVSKTTPTPPPSLDQANNLIIPSMLLEEPVYGGGSESALNKGIWRRPLSSTPDKGSNTVLVAHRFTYKNPKGTFYYLDKVSVGDQIALFWEGKKYVYTATSTNTVAATQVEVEAPTEDSRLTLYTCTPLWLPKDRLVVTAKLEKIYE